MLVVRLAIAIVLFIIACPCDAQTQTTLSPAVEYRGPCDASAAVAVDATRFLIANNEDNIIRMYRNKGSDAPLAEYDMTEFLATEADHPDAEIEGAARHGNRIYWITSHGRSRDGKLRPSRQRFWATDLDIEGDVVKLTPVGKPCRTLAEELAKDASWSRYKLEEASRKGQREVGNLNFEGLMVTPEGRVWIGLRSPTSGNKALVASLENANAVVKDSATPKFGAPMEIALGGGGIRGGEYWPARRQYVFLSGPTIGGEKTPFQVWLWSDQPREQPRPLAGLNLGDLHPESVVVYANDATRVQIICDDGSHNIGKQDCKDLAAEDQRFRSVWLTLGK